MKAHTLSTAYAEDSKKDGFTSVYNEPAKAHVVFGINTGFVYGRFQTEAQAKEEAGRMNRTAGTDA